MGISARKTREVRNMRFKILKEKDKYQIWYWTYPKNLIIRFFYSINIFEIMFKPYHCIDCFSTKKEALKHIERWNSGYYKNKYTKTWV